MAPNQLNSKLDLDLLSLIEIHLLYLIEILDQPDLNSIIVIVT